MRLLVPIIVIVVILAAVLGYGAYAGWFHTSSGSGGSSSTGAPVAFNQARSLANTSANSYQAGPWSLVAAEASNSPSAVTVTSNNVTNANDTCSYTVVGGGSLPSTYTIPAFTGSPDTGQSPFWLFFMLSSGGTLLLVIVNEGAAQNVAYFTSASCPDLVGELSKITPVPSNAVDSDTIASSVQNDGGAAFMSNHAATTVTLEVTGGATVGAVTLPSNWIVDYSTCPIAGSGGSGTQYQQSWFVGAVNGTAWYNSSVLSKPSCSSTTGSLPALSTALSFGAVSNITVAMSTVYAYETTVTVSATVTFGDIDAVDSTPPSSNDLAFAANVTVYSSAHVFIANWTIIKEAWTYAAGTSSTTAIVTGDVFVFEGYTGLDGTVVKLYASGTVYTGTAQLTL